MTSRATRLLITFVVVVGGLTTAVAASAKPSRHVAPVVVHLRFRRAGEASGITADARYIVRTGAYSFGNGTAATLIDERTGASKPIAYPGCWPSALGEPWLVYSCGPNYTTMELYALPTGGWQAVNINFGIGWGPVAIGTQWIELKEECEDDSHCTNHYVFQNLQTGAHAPDPTSATTSTDLNSRALAQTVCQPLRIPMVAGDEGSRIHAALPGSLTFSGRFAISSSDTGAHGFLERCGTRLHKELGIPRFPTGPLVGLPYGATANLVVWQSGPHQLKGLFLPSLRPFVIPLPAAIAMQSNEDTGFRGAITASSRHLYLLSSSDSSSYRSYWIAPLPSLRKPR
jgi:hypothetical protein